MVDVERKCALTVGNAKYSYPLHTWLKFCTADLLHIIPFSKIYIRPPRSISRYHLCDTRYPCILYQESDLYRVIDGLHRIQRLKDEEKTSGIFYIITPKILHDNLKPNILLPEGLQTNI